MKKYFLVVFLLFTTAAYSQNCNCGDVFSRIKQLVENNYAGWFDKTKAFNPAKFANLTKSVTAQTATIKNDSLCAKVIQKWVGYFKDGHLVTEYYPAIKEVGSGDKPLVIKQHLIKEAEVVQYLISSKLLDKAEGIWQNDSYKIAVVKSTTAANEFDGVIISTENENWKPGEVKFTVTKPKTGSYTVSYISGDKTTVTNTKAKFVKNILDADPLYISKIIPAAKDTFNLETYMVDNDPSTVKLRFPEAGVAVFSFPNFYDQNYEVLQTLLNDNKDKLAAATYWVIDVRKNEGGNIVVGKLLFPYLYTKPIIDYNAPTRLTSENYDNWFITYVKDSYNSSSKERQKRFDSTAAIVKAKFGTFGGIMGNNKIADTISYNERMPYPKKVAVLIDGNTFSSGELFTMLAKQSDKVVLYGQKTNGTIDYGNVLTYKTDCPSIRLTLPSNRYNWLNYGISVDRDKIKPDVFISSAIKDWVKFAATDLKKSK
jgi:Peptidase family S41